MPVLLFIACIPIILAQDNPNQLRQVEQDQPDSTFARTIPISDEMMTLKIVVDDSATSKVTNIIATQFEGGLIRIEKKDDWIYGFTPYRNQETGKFAVRVFRITKYSKEGVSIGEGIEELETMVLGASPDEEVLRFDGLEADFSIQFKGIQEKPASDKGRVKTQEYDNEGGYSNQCCVPCNGLMTCACKVVTDCGDCCRGACC
jgi:hypothetical protein